ncbi:MAG: signal peptidase I [Halobacteriovoraceae bacterium]|nr:signal peptidase I [Halobacteriovoraceae bacterium]
MEEQNSQETFLSRVFRKKKSSNTHKKYSKEWFKKELISFAVIGFVVFAFRSTFFEPFRIPTGSMIPTLLIGDFVLVNKFIYGFKVPYSDMFGNPIYITGPYEPKRGDIIVFKYPQNPSLNYIKRLIGVPGDEIEIDGRQIFVNGELIEMRKIGEIPERKDMVEKFKRRDFEYFLARTGNKEHNIIFEPNGSSRLYSEKFRVPPGKYFVMGDNRDNSADSRSWGFVPFENIKGRALLLWMSMTIPGLDPEHEFVFRPGRIGTILHKEIDLKK